ncbi:MtrB/PioB family decaheme-associated outer membrane protein [Paraferrimonas sedimenticola]|uniref:Membrane protein n=1 Tax=Paraferrimonas sedimenticola TaxID=375674 RepID=A0AA37W0E8_9GAMM|nr:MtrB/PioB family decaheme-associated outer membrane protein [Paraferrimonas sedimenticola]GLP96220.1 membrane protein [Paraferrimonas sedimenticola]
MKFKLNLITLALLTQSGVALADFNLNKANTESVKFDKWECKACTSDKDIRGDVSLGIGNHNTDDVRSANAFGVKDGAFGRLDADVRYSKGKNTAAFEARELGTERGDAALRAGRKGTANVELGIRQIVTYETDKALTPYRGVGSNSLTLPDNWVAAGSTQGMTELNNSLQPVTLKLKRQKGFIGAAVEGEKLWSAYVDYSREEKKGLKTLSGAFFNQSMMLASPVDYTTDLLEAGIRLQGANWYAALAYNGSRFNNGNAQLNWSNAFSPTFGGQTQGTVALDPDNQAHTISLMGKVTLGRTHLSGRVNHTKMTQNQSYVTTNYRFDVPTQSLDGKVDLTQANLKLAARVSRDVRFHAAYDYSNRDNKTSSLPYDQISIDNVNGRVALNKQYDIKTQKFKIGTDVRMAQGLKGELGYDFRRDDRSNQEREQTDEHTLWGKIRLNRFSAFDAWIRGGYSERDGSVYQASAHTSRENNALLRKYYLADRNRSFSEVRAAYTPVAAFSIDAGYRYAYDDYKGTLIGLTEAQDKYFDVNANMSASNGFTAHAFYADQEILSEQAGSASYNLPTWNSEVKDKIKSYGAGIAKNNLFDDAMTLGLDYTFNDSKSDTVVVNARPSSYGDYFSRVHNLNAYAGFQVSEQAALRLDYKLERYKDTNFANAGTTPSTIWNVVTYGDQRHDYTAHLIMLSLRYRM